MRLSYVAPRTLEEALEVLALHGSDAAVLAGGMTLVRHLRQDSLPFGVLMNIKGTGLVTAPVVDAQERVLRFGALVSHRSIEVSPEVAHACLALQTLESELASVQIRNHGTLVGNLCAAEVYTDPPCLLAAADAQIVLARASGTRTLAADDFIVGSGRTRRQDDELVSAITLALPKPGEGLGHARMTPRRGLSRPLACASVHLQLSAGGAIAALRIFVGALDAVPQRLSRAEALLQGVRPEVVPRADLDACVAEEVSCGTDERCSSSYKRQIAGVLVRRALAQAEADVNRRSAAP